MDTATCPPVEVDYHIIEPADRYRVAEMGVARQAGRIKRSWRWLVRWSRRSARLLLIALAGAFAQVIGAPLWLAPVLGLIVALMCISRGPLRARFESPRWASILLAGFLVASVPLATTSWSYTGYLTDPGAATFGVRTADWMRDHSLGPIVDQIEQRVYSRNAPNNDPVQTTQLPVPVTQATGASIMGSNDPKGPPAVTLLSTRFIADAPLDEEGAWVPNTTVASARPVSYTTFFRPDAEHLNVVVGAVWLDPAVTSLVYAPGTKQPGRTAWAWRSGIPQTERSNVVAAFNAGFKFNDIPGGMMTEGRTPYPLADGQASLVIYADGSIDIGTWGVDLVMTPEVVTVRQNLELVVDNGQPDPGLRTSIDGEWGTRRWQVQFTRRSGIGITANGALVYVAGSQLTAESLGNALAQAGAVRAMELDIHSKQPTFNFFEASPATPAGVVGTKLMPDMQREADRYLAADQRDFFAVVLR